VVIRGGHAGGSAFFSYFNSDKIAGRQPRQTCHETSTPVPQPRRGLCIAGAAQAAALRGRRPGASAFATGRNPKHSAIAVTSGLLEKMNRVELEGVLAHELSHIKNYDILVTTVAVTAIGTIALISDIGLRFAFWGGLSGRRDHNSDSGPIGAVIAIASLAILMLAPLAGYLMQMAMSRNREYLADASGVALTRYPPGLVGALEKLKGDQAVVHYATKATAQMWIEEPLETDPKKPGAKFNKLFATHPPLDDRIKRLQEM
jgi:heat shock protein HtpX